MRNTLLKKMSILTIIIPLVLLNSCRKELLLSSSSISTKTSEKEISEKKDTSSLEESSKSTSVSSSKSSSGESSKSSSKESSSSKSSSSLKPSTVEPHVHDFIEVLVKEATCYQKALYVKKCRKCGAVEGEPYYKGQLKDHEFTREIADYEYLKDDDNVLGGTLFKNAATYYKACKYCRKSAKGIDENATFISRAILKAEFGFYPQRKAADADKKKLQCMEQPVDNIYSLAGKRFIKEKDDFFMLEPLLWNVFLRNENTYTLMTDKIIDDGTFIYLNKYIDKKTEDRRHLYLQSKVRDFLNGDFYNNAFFKYAKQDQRGEINTNYLFNGSEAISFDKVFLPCRDELKDEKSNVLRSCEIINMTWSDYAYSLIDKKTVDDIVPKVWTRTNGNWSGKSTSPYYDYINDAYYIQNYKGQVSVGVGNGKRGIMPMITMSKETFLKYKLN